MLPWQMGRAGVITSSLSLLLGVLLVQWWPSLPHGSALHALLILLGAAALLLARNIEVKLGHADAARSYADRLRKDFPDSNQTHSLDAVAPKSP